jgi:aspartate aminotransferase-like enzyme
MFPQLDAVSAYSNTVTAYSNTVTAVAMPEGVTDSALRGTVKRMGIEIAGGQDHLKGKIFRIGSMGAVSAPEILATLAAVPHALKKAGVAGMGDGVGAAAEVLDA